MGDCLRRHRADPLAAPGGKRAAGPARQVAATVEHTVENMFDHDMWVDGE